jgi:menaquinone-dependent protoporphyrinogen oxidase
MLYGTTEGQTRKIAQFVHDRLVDSGSNVDLMDSTNMAEQEIELSRYDVVIIAASLHSGRYQSAVEHFVNQRRDALNAMPSAFVSVSLSAAGDDEDDIQGLAKCVSDFKRVTGWQPRWVHHSAGAFRYTQYDFFKRWALKYIAWRKGAPTDTSRDYELTDWDALGQFADELLAEIQAKARGV